jgi:prolyl-tRNA synthetase
MSGQEPKIIKWSEIQLKNKEGLTGGQATILEATFNNQIVMLKKFSKANSKPYPGFELSKEYKSVAEQFCVEEFNLLNKLKHERVIKTFGYSTDDGDYFLILEKADRPSQRNEIIKNGRKTQIFESNC